MPGRTATSKDLPANWNFELISDGDCRYKPASSTRSIVMNKIYDSPDDVDRPNKYAARIDDQDRLDDSPDGYGKRVAEHGHAYMQEGE